MGENLGQQVKQIADSQRTGRLIAIGDIHGYSRALTSLLKRIRPVASDMIVCLGDTINRGPDSRGVLEQLIDLGKTCKVVCVLGNHEESMLDARTNSYALRQFEDMGGQETLVSYGEDCTIDNVPKEHWDLLESFVPYFETDNFIIVHANYNWYTPMPEQHALLLRWTSIEDEPPNPHVSGKTVVVGHSPGKIRDLGFCLCIDTGCGFGGPLTAVSLRSNTYRWYKVSSA